MCRWTPPRCVGPLFGTFIDKGDDKSKLGTAANEMGCAFGAREGVYVAVLAVISIFRVWKEGGDWPTWALVEYQTHRCFTNGPGTNDERWPCTTWGKYGSRFAIAIYTRL